MKKEKNIWGLTPFGDEKFSISPEHAKHLSESKRPSSKKQNISPQLNKSITQTKKKSENNEIDTEETTFIEEFSKEHHSNINDIIKQWKKICKSYLTILKSKYFIILNMSKVNPNKKYIQLTIHPKQLTLKIIENKKIISNIEIKFTEQKATQLFLMTNILQSDQKESSNQKINIDDLLLIIENCKILRHDLKKETAHIIAISTNKTHRHAKQPLNNSITTNIVSTANIKLESSLHPINITPIIGQYFLDIFIKNYKNKTYSHLNY